MGSGFITDFDDDLRACKGDASRFFHRCDMLVPHPSASAVLAHECVDKDKIAVLEWYGTVLYGTI